MLDPQLFRNDLDAICKQLLRRGIEFDQSKYSSLEMNRKSIQQQVEDLQSQRNKGAKAIGIAKRNGEDVTKILADMDGVNQALKLQEAELKSIQESITEMMAVLPNILDEQVPKGQSEDDNLEISRWGDIPNFDFEAKDHVTLGEQLGGLNAALGAKITASRFTVLKGDLAHLHRALANWMLNVHTQEHGYVELNVPTIVNRDTLYGNGNLPKFEEDLFKLEGEPWCLSPTAEVAINNIFRDELIDEQELPIQLTAHSVCYRSEAGSYGKDTRGFIRQHQFEKVELIHIVKPEDSQAAHERLVSNAETILQRLELPYRKVMLCEGDTGFAAQKTYDLEVWLPGQSAYREISSCSNTGDFQARRMSARFRRKGQKKTEWVHSLNGTGVAVGRALVAILENYQEADGRIRVPEVLKPWLQKDYLEPVV